MEIAPGDGSRSPLVGGGLLVVDVVVVGTISLCSKECPGRERRASIAAGGDQREKCRTNCLAVLSSRCKFEIAKIKNGCVKSGWFIQKGAIYVDIIILLSCIRRQNIAVSS